LIKNFFMAGATQAQIQDELLKEDFGPEKIEPFNP
jgi:hypothetical protein